VSSGHQFGGLASRDGVRRVAGRRNATALVPVPGPDSGGARQRAWFGVIAGERVRRACQADGKDSPRRSLMTGRGTGRRRPRYSAARGLAADRRGGPGMPPSARGTPCIRRSAADPQRSIPRNRSRSVIGHGALLVAASGILVAAHTGRRARTGARSSSRGKRDAHGALPKRLHAVRPLDRHITRSLTARPRVAAHRMRTDCLLRSNRCMDHAQATDGSLQQRSPYTWRS